MSFSWGDYHKLAIELNNNNNQNNRESRKRSAVSRAYYAAYNIAVDFAFDFYEDFEIDRQSSHKSVAEWFETNEPIVGIELRNLFKFRKMCDYDDKVENLERIVKDSIEWSNNIIEKINKQRESKNTNNA